MKIGVATFPKNSPKNVGKRFPKTKPKSKIKILELIEGIMRIKRLYITGTLKTEECLKERSGRED